jgi:dTDP-4-amino-4,6-dideoxygalactose transaminase
MNERKCSRRDFIRTQAVIGSMLASGVTSRLRANDLSLPGLPSTRHPARLSARNGRNWPEWPFWDPQTDEKGVLEVLRSGVWSRAGLVTEFEKKWAEMTGAKRCLSVVNGTNALIASLTQLGIGGGDEVILPPYTFIATAAAILMTGAMPVFADIDPETFQIKPENIEKKITPRTRAIVPVHILGLPADMVSIMKIANKHDLFVVEDACQAWLAEINHQKVGTFGHAGCFSFQNSKNFAIGEGGAIVSNDEAFMDRCYSFHNYGNAYGTNVNTVDSGTVMLGTKLRITEYQAAIGLAQLTRLEEQTKTRNENAAHLRGLIETIPGIIPYRLYEGVTRAAFHLFPFRYQKDSFQGLSKNEFIKRLRAEGVPCSGGYAPLNKMPYLKQAFGTKNFRKMYPEEMLDINRYHAQNQCPANDRLCSEEAVWLPQNVLLTQKSDMDFIAEAIRKVYNQAK